MRAVTTLNCELIAAGNRSTRIEFEIPAATYVELNIYNILGKKIKTLVNEQLTAGRKAVTWDGTDNDNNPVTSGMYFYRMSADGYTEGKKMLLLK